MEGEEEEEGSLLENRTTKEINGSLILSADGLRQYIINTILILISFVRDCVPKRQSLNYHTKVITINGSGRTSLGG